jgi:hypothetical protein
VTSTLWGGGPEKLKKGFLINLDLLVEVMNKVNVFYSVADAMGWAFY